MGLPGVTNQPLTTTHNAQTRTIDSLYFSCLNRVHEAGKLHQGGSQAGAGSDAASGGPQDRECGWAKWGSIKPNIWARGNGDDGR